MVPVVRALLLALMIAAPAAAQTPPGYVTEGEWAAAEAAARQREVALENRLNALDAARRAEEGIQALREQSERARSPSLSEPYVTAPRALPDPGGMATIPDSRLARSNARVREAAENRR